MKKPLLFCIAAALSVFVTVRTQAQVSLSFSGGSGTPLGITFSQPEIFSITDSAATAPVFLVQGLGNLFPNMTGVAPTGVNGTVAFQVNGGAQIALTTARSGFTGGNTMATDTYFFNTTLPGVATGNVVTLGAGTETTTSNYAAAAPASGKFNVFIINGDNGSFISTIGSTVPEPSTWALLGLGAIVVALRLRRTVACRQAR